MDQSAGVPVKCQFGSLIRESEVCVICGIRPAETGEHIPPKGLFTERPQAYLVVPACKPCNEGTKLDDEYFRQVLSACSWTEEAHKVWKEKVASKFPQFPATQAGLRDSLDTMPVAIPNLGEIALRALRVKASRVDRVAEKMVRGLHWFHTGQILDADTEILVRFLNIADVQVVLDDPDYHEVIDKCMMGVYRHPDVIRTFFYNFALGPTNSLWHLFFYRQNAMAVLTGPLPAED
jgi:hypothetical protein